jgi:hypothetical protein
MRIEFLFDTFSGHTGALLFGMMSGVLRAFPVKTLLLILIGVEFALVDGHPEFLGRFSPAPSIFFKFKQAAVVCSLHLLLVFLDPYIECILQHPCDSLVLQE